MKQKIVLSLLVSVFSCSLQAGEFATCMERCKDKTVAYLGGSVSEDQILKLANFCAKNDCLEEAKNEEEKREQREKQTESDQRFAKKAIQEWEQRRCLESSTPFSGMFCYIWANPNGF